MLTPTAPVGSYELAWSRDSAINLPADPKAAEEALRVARETGDWSPLVAPGSRPTYFVMRAIPYATMQRWADARRANGGTQGPNESLFSLFQLALMSIKNFGDVEFQRIEDPRFRDKRAPDSVLDVLASALRPHGLDVDDLVLELAAAVYARETITDPKS